MFYMKLPPSLLKMIQQPNTTLCTQVKIVWSS